ncbi:MAG: TIGR00730 family Rossman fold protein [Crocinitomix sp.]|nr:TIGR00730 family Rossman fold protein [Crocinitomix sp.]
MKSITVFCGSSSGNDSNYELSAFAAGQHLAAENITVIYGGAQIGLMGKVAEGALQNKGEVIGVIPHFLSGKEILHEGLTELIQVDTMHERKTIMAEKSDGFIALPGGFGTFEELFEILTWAQLGLHQKPIGILNIDGFYDDLLEMIQKMVDKGFLKTINQDMLLKSGSIADLVTQMRSYKAPDVPKWIKSDET